MPLVIVPRPSPNHGARPANVPISVIVLHADAGTTEEGTLSWLVSPASEVSYHYLVGRTGTVYQVVQDQRRAWHAGKSVFLGVPNVNDFSLGVSFANDQKGEAFGAAQLAAGVALVASLCVRLDIPINRITTHAVISPGRKHDPGPLFPFTRFIAEVACGTIAGTPP